MSSTRIINSTWHVLEQPPPPSLREVLGAYNTRGDGDRDMLIAMLNAKTAEDQRLASVAALHRTLLEMQGICPSSFHCYDPAPPPMYAQEHRRSPQHTDVSQHSSSSQRSRKRQRTPRHPASPISASSRRSRSPHHSSHSSSRDDSSEYSPRSRASMAIGTLLSATSDPAENHRDYSLGPISV